MHRVTKRVWIVVLFILILVGGMTFFLVDYSMNAAKWVSFTGSPHVYNKSNLGYGTVCDRSGAVLLDTTDGRAYSENDTIRKSTVHWLGDRQGNISAAALASYAGHMAGFDKVNGIYAYGGEQGQATLTLSGQIQAVALESLGKRKGTVAVYNYLTGEILCAVTTPNFDPDNPPDIAGDTSGAYEGLYLNRFLQSTYPPGSIFKLVTTAAALDSLDNARELEFRCRGYYDMDGGRVKCSGEHGKITLERAMRKSCNCYFAQLTEELGAETLQQYVEQFQVTQPIEFDGITTAKGNFDIAGAMDQEIAWAGIGQHHDTVNPCRYMTFLGAIAGGGEAAQPYIVESAGAKLFGSHRASRTSTGRIMAKETAEAIAELLRNNVENQYGDENFPGLTVCAKTGTAEVGGGKEPNATFAGFCSDRKYPLAFMVVVEDAGSGSKTCIPIMSEVLAACKELMDSE